MTEEDKKQIAAFRFGVICELVNGADLDPGEQERLIREKCARKWQLPLSGKTGISRSTLLRWVSLYRRSNGKLESLYPRGRCDQGESRAIDEDTCLALADLRKHLPKVPIKYLIREMEQRRLTACGQLKPSTV